ncbi:hypothetical protein BU24DRAFT_450253 [Aaosphaeria arxii CBS 175.79]|uniref:Uncharacterized protein n=1 Tax=Aaosphaeria arxii CBS 175.79 TaxID=1450172 RepID=A0A6A5XQK4_9PLEO|nr:uncharacterized protein BU24DRAFT_450253 [Aaosphaeria arxii CBS 175.79]KAF2015558.1 hypothetical protein BU24DRAFT_450253 [Aaosphaeria arxii CBS 175.79]
MEFNPITPSTSDEDLPFPMDIDTLTYGFIPGIPILEDHPSPPLINIHALLASYLAAYMEPVEAKATQLERGKALASALASHYYPEAQGFSVQDKNFVMAKFGWSFELDGKRNTAPFHLVQPEHIGGFVVNKKQVVEFSDGSIQEVVYPHTYICIMADDLATREHWLNRSHLCRGDIMSLPLGFEANIKKGHCVLIIGTQMEFYQFDADDGRMPIRPWPVDEKNKKYRQNWSLDLTKWSMDVADIWWTWLAESKVTYQNGYVAEGSEFERVVGA